MLQSPYISCSATQHLGIGPLNEPLKICHSRTLESCSSDIALEDTLASSLRLAFSQVHEEGYLYLAVTAVPACASAGVLILALRVSRQAAQQRLMQLQSAVHSDCRSVCKLPTVLVGIQIRRAAA